ncbi:hypothetical protein ACFTWD_01120 [Streptomyces sp. NPDC056943]|uniref:hypothetical protein n=1 Tax=Streptomyces sp. NPDC056943 TaxID=3345971 RepID=UPI003641D5C3
MTDDKHVKRAARKLAATEGISYTAARRRLGSPTPLVRTLLMPITQEGLSGLYELDSLLVALRRAWAPDGHGVQIPGAPIEDVFDVYFQVRDTLPEGTEELVDGSDEYLPYLPLLRAPDGGYVGYVAAIEVAEADLALFAAFADALDHAAGPRPGPEFKALKEALGEFGQNRRGYQWLPQGNEATVARWARQSLAPVLHSPFEGPHGAADHEVLSAILRYAQGEASVQLDQDEEAAVCRVMFSMTCAAAGYQPEVR